jgi:hypothetical protein
VAAPLSEAVSRTNEPIAIGPVMFVKPELLEDDDCAWVLSVGELGPTVKVSDPHAEVAPVFWLLLEVKTACHWYVPAVSSWVDDEAGGVALETVWVLVNTWVPVGALLEQPVPVYRVYFTDPATGDAVPVSVEVSRTQLPMAMVPEMFENVVLSAETCACVAKVGVFPWTVNGSHELVKFPGTSDVSPL